MAKAMDVHYGTISRAEREDAPGPSLELVRKMAEAIKEDPDYWELVYEYEALEEGRAKQVIGKELGHLQKSAGAAKAPPAREQSRYPEVEAYIAERRRHLQADEVAFLRNLLFQAKKITPFLLDSFLATYRMGKNL
ncbi:helix-turn-helix domain-containing protein [bacterium]|nr:helix-turn-helix domain-containing protein [bacterium]